jgi:hypothetical protein
MFGMRNLLNSIWVSLIFLGTISAGAQEQFIEPQAKKLTTIPFQLLSGGVIIVKAKLNNYPDSLNFILDTGSGGISLDSITVEKNKIPVVPNALLSRFGSRPIEFPCQ